MVTKKKAPTKSKKSTTKAANKVDEAAPIPAATAALPEPIREFLKQTSIPGDLLTPRRSRW